MFMFNVAQRTLYDIRGANGTGTSANPVSSTSANAKKYTIRKLADGNCWMTEDLNLPLSVGTTVEASYNDGSTFSWAPMSSSSCPTSGTGSNWWWKARCAMTGVTEQVNGMWYYNFWAATAERNTSYVSNVDVDGSICPKGWKLPNHYSSIPQKSYTSLLNTYGIFFTADSMSVVTSAQFDSLLDFPFNIVLGGRKGYYSAGGMTMQGHGVNLWESRLGNPTDSLSILSGYVLGMADSTNESGNYLIGVNAPNGYYGHFVRCVAI